MKNTTKRPHILLSGDTPGYKMTVVPYEQPERPNITELITQKTFDKFKDILEPYPYYSIEVDHDDHFSLSIEVRNEDGDYRGGTFSVEASVDVMLVEINIILKGFSPGLTYKPDPKYPKDRWG